MVEKYIDLSQFPKAANRGIDWKHSVGLTVQFLYDGSEHQLKILEYPKKDYLLISLDGQTIDRLVHTTKVTNLTFGNELGKRQHFYCAGDVIRHIQIIDTDDIFQGQRRMRKAYKCQCLVDGHIFHATETSLKDGHGCPVCTGRTVMKGVNDVATTDPHLLRFFKNKSDAYTHTRKSSQMVQVCCPLCGHERSMRVADLTVRQQVVCPMCHKGLSYPNRFAHILFSQLQSQTQEYKCEYSPKWLGKLRFDNYCVLADGRKLAIEFDGGFHFMASKTDLQTNDRLKDQLCQTYDVIMLRVDCNYPTIDHRFDYIKSNIIKGLSEYFDLSGVDWEQIRTQAAQDTFVEVADFYRTHPTCNIADIMECFHLSKETVYAYLREASSLGLCDYVANDRKRLHNSKPISMYSPDGALIGIYKSAKDIEDQYPQFNFKHRSLRKAISQNKPYKGFIFQWSSFQEYQLFNTK